MEITLPSNVEDISVETIPHPKRHWRRSGGVEGDTGPEYEAAFLAAQQEIGPILQADAENAFNKSKYLSLPRLLAKVVPASNRHGLTVKQGASATIMYGGVDNPRRLLLLPIWTIARHTETGQWERVTVEIPLLKLDPQGLASTFTYGRRIALQGFWCVAGTDDDGVLGSLKPRLDTDPIEDATAGMIEQINDCDTMEQLKSWYQRNEQGFELLSEPVLQRLREAYSKHSAFLKSANAQTSRKQRSKEAMNAGG